MIGIATPRVTGFTNHLPQHPVHRHLQVPEPEVHVKVGKHSSSAIL